MLKPLLWLGSSRNDVRNFPTEARKRVGYDLHLLQSGLDPSDWKPVSAVGSGVREIRIHSGLEHRVLYIAKFEEGVYVLHAFEKKSRRTGNADLELARERLREVLKARRT